VSSNIFVFVFVFVFVFIFILFLLLIFLLLPAWVGGNIIRRGGIIELNERKRNRMNDDG
jgi:hypothetical protein